MPIDEFTDCIYLMCILIIGFEYEFIFPEKKFLLQSSSHCVWKYLIVTFLKEVRSY